jgi:hypothetical protein
MRQWCLGIALAALLSGAARAEEPWLAAWEAAPAQQLPAANAALAPLEGQTLRQRLTSSVSGRRVQVTFTNAYGAKALMIGAASVGKLAGGRLDPASVRPLAFGGASAIAVPPGAPALSDPVDLAVAPDEVLAISLYLPEATLPDTYHRPVSAVDTAGTTLGAGGPEAMVSGAKGDFTRSAELTGARPTARLFVSRLDVQATAAKGAILVLGTTRTEGEGRWPEILARRLAAAGRPMAVANASMVANPLTHPYPGGGEAALARFDRDVLMAPGVRYVIVADAINDIGQAGRPGAGGLPTTADLAAAYRQLVSRAHARGVKVIAATVMPFAGVPFPEFYSPAKEAARGDLNAWIRTSGAFDGVIDMDALVRDPADPLHYAKGLDAANHFAPSEAGEARIGQGVDLRLFR